MISSLLSPTAYTTEARFTSHPRFLSSNAASSVQAARTSLPLNVLTAQKQFIIIKHHPCPWDLFWHLARRYLFVLIRHFISVQLEECEEVIITCVLTLIHLFDDLVRHSVNPGFLRIVSQG